MTWKAYVEHDHSRMGVAVHLGQIIHVDGARMVRIAQPAELAVTTAESDEGATITTPPWLRLPEDVAHALLDALAAHFAGASDTRQLRRDYDAERARTDKLTDAVIRIAVSQTGAPQ